MSDEKYCEDCGWFQKEDSSVFPDPYMCWSPMVVKTSRAVCPVLRPQRSPALCSKERTDGTCGAEGRLYWWNKGNGYQGITTQNDWDREQREKA